MEKGFTLIRLFKRADKANMQFDHLMSYAQTLILVNLIVVKTIVCFCHNSEPCRIFWTILRHKLPIITPDLPIPTRDLNSSVQPEFLNPKFLYKTEKTSRVLTAERKIASLIFAIRIRAMMIISEYYQLDVLGSNSFLENVAK